MAFLEAGVLSEGNFLRSDAGVPQGGILSPLLANTALGVIEERYERHVWPIRIPPSRRDAATPERRAAHARKVDRARQAAGHEKAAVAELPKEKRGLELSETMTLVTPVTTTFAFLGHHVCVRHDRALARTSVVTLIPKQRSHQTRERIESFYRRNRTGQELRELPRDLNWLRRGWSAFYRPAWGAQAGLLLARRLRLVERLRRDFSGS